MKKLPIGIDDFAKVIEGDYYYVDKSLIIKEVLDSGSEVTLLPRPRRFGKTLNLSLLYNFFQKTEHSKAHLFSHLSITHHPEAMAHQGNYPIIFLTFKDVKASSWAECYSKMIRLIADEYRRHNYLLDSEALDAIQKRDFRDIIARRADKTTYENSLKDLTSHLFNYHHVHPIILIDEYDTPIHSGFAKKYYDETVEFLRNFLGEGLKGNKNLKFAVITGILRIAKESIFSGLNNLDVCTLTDTDYADKFGLLEHEVTQILSDYALNSAINDVRQWYNGYSSGNHTVYNPWSIINFVKKQGEFKTYWINTSDNELIINLLKQSSSSVKKDFEALLNRQSITKELQENIVFRDIATQEDALWNFLLYCGYLTWKNKRLVDEEIFVDLSIPNGEVKGFYKKTVTGWFTRNSDIGRETYDALLSSLISGDIETFEELFSSFVMKSLSYFDIKNEEPERTYHAFVLGMLVGLSDEYEVKSNRESGLGRYDVMVIPRDKQKLGIILEFKKVDSRKNETLENAANNALKQIKEKQYVHELKSRGISDVLCLGIAFEGKKVLIKHILERI